MSDSRPVKRACLVMPGYGDVTIGAAIGLYEAAGPTVTVNGVKYPFEMARRYNAGSLLGQNFNCLWAWIRNENREQQVDYAGMLHSDVEPQASPWFSLAIEEMEAKSLDLLGVVVPLKCPAGLTSIALGRKDGNPWRPQCRLTMKEIFSLPETFTSDDVGYPLLINTGMWVCRVDDWIYKVHFTVNDRIIFDASRGCDVAEVEPEDWYFSRRCHELGLRIGVTRKIPVTHAGPARFTNSVVWGEQAFDSEYVPESIIPIHNESEAAASPPAAVLQEV